MQTPSAPLAARSSMRELLAHPPPRDVPALRALARLQLRVFRVIFWCLLGLVMLCLAVAASSPAGGSLQWVVIALIVSAFTGIGWLVFNAGCEQLIKPLIEGHPRAGHVVRRGRKGAMLDIPALDPERPALIGIVTLGGGALNYKDKAVAQLNATLDVFAVANEQLGTVVLEDQRLAQVTLGRAEGGSWRDKMIQISAKLGR